MLHGILPKFLPGTSNTGKWSSGCIKAVSSFREHPCDVFIEDLRKGEVGRIAYHQKKDEELTTFVTL
jgi:hypothetical protein